jgi:hypothetical protein
MKTGIDVEKLSRLQTASEMRLFRLRHLSDQIAKESGLAAAELADAKRGVGNEVLHRGNSVEEVIASLSAALEAMRKAGDYRSEYLSAATARLEAAKRSAAHRARMAALMAERGRLEPVHHEQGRLLYNLNVFAGVIVPDTYRGLQQ